MKKIVFYNPQNTDVRVFDHDQKIPPVSDELPFGCVIEDAPDTQTAAFLGALQYVPWDAIEVLFEAWLEENYGAGVEVPLQGNTSKEQIEQLAAMLGKYNDYNPLENYKWNEEEECWER